MASEIGVTFFPGTRFEKSMSVSFSVWKEVVSYETTGPDRPVEVTFYTHRLKPGMWKRTYSPLNDE